MPTRLLHSILSAERITQCQVDSSLQIQTPTLIETAYDLALHIGFSNIGRRTIKAYLILRKLTSLHWRITSREGVAHLLAAYICEYSSQFDYFRLHSISLQEKPFGVIKMQETFRWPGLHDKARLGNLQLVEGFPTLYKNPVSRSWPFRSLILAPPPVWPSRSSRSATA